MFMVNILLIIIAKYLFILPIIILGIYFFVRQQSSKKKMVIFAMSSALLTYFIGLIGNQIYSSPRPFVVGHFNLLIAHAPDNGFPSDHTLLAAALAATSSYWNWRLGISLWMITLFVALSRIFTGLHHSIDVIGSMIIAIIATTVVYVFFRYIWHENII